MIAVELGISSCGPCGPCPGGAHKTFPRPQVIRPLCRPGKGQLQDLIRAVQDAIDPLEARIQILEEERRGTELEKNGEASASQNGQKSLDQILQIVLDHRAEIMALKRELEAFHPKPNVGYEIVNRMIFKK
jgi:hypothetical protein